MAFSSSFFRFRNRGDYSVTLQAFSAGKFHIHIQSETGSFR
ncbi:hypothetical protein ASZ90_015662 [hydrocarbon metagenome]|uniref:Uncharacterized protein n=1 Tax=hydrocarbon metagenome TaxID=938273 RepID=A0A0W8F1C1_9ZZZZ